MTWFILLLVAGGRCIQLLYYYNINVDGLYQVMAMQNFAHGHGITIASALPSDLSSVSYTPLINWPPGYSWLLAPFYLLFGHDYISAGIFLDIFFALLLLLMTRKLLRLMEIPLWLVNIYTLTSGFFIYYFYFINSTDAIAVSLCSVSLYYAFRMIRSGKAGWLSSIGMTLPLVAAGAIKYLFMPLAFVLPFYLLLLSLKGGYKGFRKHALMSMAVLALGFGLLLAWQKITGGSAYYISQPERGFYPENIGKAWPVLPASFIKPPSVLQLTGHKAALKGPVLRLFQIVHVLLLAGWVFLAWREWRNRKKRTVIATDHFYRISLLFLFAVTVILGWLSLRVAKEEIMPNVLWTYIEEPRYYGWVNVLLHLGVFLLYAYRGSAIWPRVKLLMILLLALMMPEMFKGAVFTARRIGLMGKEEYSWQSERNVQRFADTIIQKNRTLHPEASVVATGSWYYFYYRIALYSHVAALKEAELLNDPARLHTSKPVVLLAAIYKDHVKDFSAFLANPEKQFAGEMNGFYFYTLHVGPR